MEAFGEPAVDRREKIARFGAPALVLARRARLTATRNTQRFTAWPRRSIDVPCG
jgi:hypothetical protein